MKLAMIRQGFCLVPADDESMELFKKLKKADVLECNVKEYRNYKFHKKYFALINLAFENQEFYKDLNQFRKIMEMKAGYFDIVPTDKGVVYLPKSISFSKLPQSEFEELYYKVLDEVIKLLNCDKNDLLNQLVGFI